jgi:nitrate/TMAO reductase-like tetraheme cytochrome c subunit
LIRNLWSYCSILILLLFPYNQLYSITLVFSGDLRGEIKPCGCAEEGDMGGLPRRASLIKQLGEESKLLYFDLGNNFPKPSEQGNLKVGLIQKSLKEMNPSLILMGSNEFSYGKEFIDLQLPYLLSNGSDQLPYLKNFNSEIDGKPLQVFGYLSPDLVYQNPNDPPSVFPVDQLLLERWRGEMQGDSWKLLLFRGSSKELEIFQQFDLFNLIFSGSDNDDELDQRMDIETSLGTVPMIPTKGQGVVAGRFKDGEIEPVGDLDIPENLGVTWLRNSIEDDLKLEEYFETYDAEVKELFFTNLDRMESQRKESPFIGEAVCAACHIESAKVWNQSQHAHAFETLKKEDKHFDPECLECHVVGLKPLEVPLGANSQIKKWEGMVGFLSPDLTPHLKNVQCENCHGPARAHLLNPNQKPPIIRPAETCVNCHKGSHSPLFDFDIYWPKIQHK